MTDVAHHGGVGPSRGPGLRYRHSLPVRAFHWINALCLLVLLMSGLQIFNAHPALYWGERSDRDRPLLAMRGGMSKGGQIKGVTLVGDRVFDTTGLFGVSRNANDRSEVRGFPDWATIPSNKWLAMARRWHLFFAWLLVINGACYALHALASRHLQRHLLPTGGELRGIGRSILDHLRFRHPEGEAATRYNVLQKLTYLAVVFALGPLIVATGMTMSPMLDATFPWLLTLFDGRQSARTLHFATAAALVAFVVIHLFMVLVTGPWNNLRSMLTGWYRVRESGGHHDR